MGTGALRISMRWLQNGTFSVYLNGKLEASFKDVKMKNKAVHWLRLPPNAGGELHRVVLELAQVRRWAYVELDDIKLFMEPAFGECESKKLCMKQMLSNGRATKGSALLRSSQRHQLACLENASLNGSIAGLQQSCDSWKRCLSISGMRQNLTDLLSASVSALPGASALTLLPALSASVEGSSNASPSTSSSTGCLTPSSLDPEAWECDCHEKMKERCQQVEAKVDLDSKLQFYPLCYRAIICDHKAICKAWKDVHCDPTQKLITKIQGHLKQSLLQSRTSSNLLAARAMASGGFGAGIDVEHAMSAKDDCI